MAWQLVKEANVPIPIDETKYVNYVSWGFKVTSEDKLVHFWKGSFYNGRLAAMNSLLADILSNFQSNYELFNNIINDVKSYILKIKYAYNKIKTGVDIGKRRNIELLQMLIEDGYYQFWKI